MDEMRFILEEIASGVTLFKPNSKNEDDVINFQKKARIISHININKMVGGIKEVRENNTGKEYIVEILIYGGLTYTGESYLRLEK
ncbi:hypothetical protein [Acidithiobacillus thiooxidans]|mgnify:CR=1 FL=1|jgi:hypothetical protein|uniref:hypothetical protein n=1 Tax=Acidithiobacillus thiooxidans TaxID=930 RepID=UPI001C06914C|nr:hypothetical protein [Acidithiobacillus thiooxidans]MBU2841982.1 hypothetical protein [Acidithiobacillus thiooxidans]